VRLEDLRTVEHPIGKVIKPRRPRENSERERVSGRSNVPIKIRAADPIVRALSVSRDGNLWQVIMDIE
jgi:hypothetical protein